MQSDPDCPVCGGHAWTVVERRTFRAADGPRRGPYVALRYRVLFELWWPQAAEVVLTLQYCGGCGLLLYAPRPTKAELDAKYRFLEQSRPTPVRPNPERARHLFRRIAPHLPMRPISVLDLGGGTGSLLTGFVERGDRCYTVDYVAQTVPGVERLASVLEELPADRRFDLVICSHVLEHVVEPLELLTRLVERLEPDGLAYVEVPMELLGGAPRLREPVTHINFFTPGATELMCARAGLERLSGEVTPLLEVMRSYDTSFHALGRRSSVAQATAPAEGLARQTERALVPSVAAGVRRLANVGGEALRRLKGALVRASPTS
jgi:SAM-dependent methyltransferase